MKITDLGKKAIIDNLHGSIGFIGEVKEVAGTSPKTGKDYSFHAQFIVLNNVKGEITNPMDDSVSEIEDKSVGINVIVSVSGGTDIVDDMKGQTLSLTNLTINDYLKDGQPQRSLKAKMPDKVSPAKEEELKEVAKGQVVRPEQKQIKEEVGIPCPICGQFLFENSPHSHSKDDKVSTQLDRIENIVKKIEVYFMELSVVKDTTSIDTLTEEEKSLKTAKTSPKLETITYNENEFKIEAKPRQLENEVIWDINILEVPKYAKTIVGNLPIEVSVLNIKNQDGHNFLKMLVARVEKDNKKLAELIQEKIT